MKTFEMAPLETAKMTKMHHEYPKYPKTLENDQKCPQKDDNNTENFWNEKNSIETSKICKILSKSLKMTKIPIN